MRKNSLASTGLSLSQAQSISNLCNQRALEIAAKLSGVNNYKKCIEVPTSNGGSKNHTLVVGKPLPKDVVDLLTEKARLHGCQAFLMENIKAKDALLKELKRASADVSSVEIPERPKTVSPLVKQLSEVGEEWGWEQLSVAETNEFLEAEAFAAHIGQFIHSGSPLDNLRKELGQGIAPTEWMNIQDGIKSAVEVTVHDTHTPEVLLEVHEALAKIHRDKEQRVNYFKAKVKNLSTAENARIAKINADAQNDAEKLNNEAQAAYETTFRAASEKIRSIQMEFEKTRQASIKETAAMRIQVDARFQEVVDEFLGKLPVPAEE
jgi:hypothetical protein